MRGLSTVLTGTAGHTGHHGSAPGCWAAGQVPEALGPVTLSSLSVQPQQVWGQLPGAGGRGGWWALRYQTCCGNEPFASLAGSSSPGDVAWKISRLQPQGRVASSPSLGRSTSQGDVGTWLPRPHSSDPILLHGPDPWALPQSPLSEAAPRGSHPLERPRRWGQRARPSLGW